MTARKGKASIRDVPVPALSPTDVLVKVEYAASVSQFPNPSFDHLKLPQNPTDAAALNRTGAPGALLGCDFSGTVVSLGTSVTLLKVGDKIAASVHGGKFPDKGSYAQYLKIDEVEAWKVSPKTDMAEAATFGVGYVTAALVNLT